MDGLLNVATSLKSNAKSSNNIAESSEGVSDDKTIYEKDKKKLIVKNTNSDTVNNRRSRSLDDLLDDTEEVCGDKTSDVWAHSMESLREKNNDHCENLIETKNAYNKHKTVTNANREHETMSFDDSNNVSLTEQPRGNDIITVDNSIKCDSNSEILDDIDDLNSNSENSTCSRQNSIQSIPSIGLGANTTTSVSSPDQKNKNTLINRYVKKVKNLIKK